MIWEVKIPLEVAWFSWLMAKEAALTHEKLRSTGFNAPDVFYMGNGQR